MHAHHLLWREQAEIARDRRAPVAALRAVAGVAQARHQHLPRVGDAPHIPPAFTCVPGKREPGDAGRDDVKGIRWIAAVRPGVGKRPDNVDELDDGAGPAVGQDQRQGVWLGRAHVQEVDGLAVDRGLELREGVEPRFPPAPVVPVTPVCGEVLGGLQGDTVVPGHIRKFVRPAGGTEALVQVIQVRVRDGDLERHDGVGGTHE